MPGEHRALASHCPTSAAPQALRSATWGPRYKGGPAKDQYDHAGMSQWQTHLKHQKPSCLQRKTQEKLNLSPFRPEKRAQGYHCASYIWHKCRRFPFSQLWILLLQLSCTKPVLLLGKDLKHSQSNTEILLWTSCWDYANFKCTGIKSFLQIKMISRIPSIPSGGYQESFKSSKMSAPQFPVRSLPAPKLRNQAVTTASNTLTEKRSQFYLLWRPCFWCSLHLFRSLGNVGQWSLGRNTAFLLLVWVPWAEVDSVIEIALFPILVLGCWLVVPGSQREGKLSTMRQSPLFLSCML